MRIILSSRKSDLARIQAFRVAQALKEAHPQLEVECRFRESLGDKNLTDPLWKMPEKGVFTEDFLEDLIEGKTDLVVHSWKDLPAEERAHTKIAATLPRADARDILLVRKDRFAQILKAKNLKIFSSSPRRAYNLDPLLKDVIPGDIEKVIFESVRGNVPTRLSKMMSGDVDGLVVAKAALDRLLDAKEVEFTQMQASVNAILGQCLIMILPLEQNPTAAAQGALAIEINSKRQDLVKLLSSIHCQKTFEAVEQERAILKGYGGGCHQKVGVSVRNLDYGRFVYVKALTDQGQIVDRVDFSPSTSCAKVPLNTIFPASAGDANWFSREKVKSVLPTGPLWIAKAEALPDEFVVEPDRLVWASGFETWKRLAKKGLWVSGCSESLGESMGLEQFSLWKNFTWTKLTHVDGNSSGSDKTILGTYKLVPLEKAPNISGKTHFYWMSGSSFERALELNPWLKEAHHSCGPGNTFDIISKHVEAHVYPNYQIWKEQVMS